MTDFPLRAFVQNGFVLAWLSVLSFFCVSLNAVEFRTVTSISTPTSQHPPLNDFVRSAHSLNTHFVAFFPSASRVAEGNDGILHIVNVDSADNTISIEATDDDGNKFGPVSIDLSAGKTIVLSAADLENGNEDKGLTTGLGAGSGDWRLAISSTSRIDVFVYLSQGEDLYSTLHDVIEPTDNEFWIPLLPADGQLSTESYLRVSNLSGETADITIHGRDDDGVLSGQVRLQLNSGSSRWLSVSDLESGEDLSGELGDLEGNWRLTVRANARIQVMVFVSNETGELNSLSTVRRDYSTISDDGQSDNKSSQTVWLSGADSDRGEFFLRVMNQSDRSGQVTISAQDESDATYDRLILTLDSFEAKQLTADDLEQGNDSKNLEGSLGDGDGIWWLTVSSDLDIEIGSYVNGSDASLASLQAEAPIRGASNVRIVQLLNTVDSATTNLLRFDIENDTATRIQIVGVDGAGEQSEPVSLTISAEESATVTSNDLINGSENLSGSLGAGTGRWKLAIWSDNSIRVVNLLQSANRLINVSTTTTTKQDTIANSANGDFNGDGKTDIVLRHIDGRWHYYPMDRSSPLADEQGPLAFEEDLHWQLAGIGDFDADGRDDILLRHTDGNWMGYLMDGKDVKSSSTVDLPTEVEWSTVGIGEFTGDGKEDVVLRHTDGRWRIVALNGLEVDTTKSGELNPSPELDSELAGFGDLDGDGWKDVVLRNRISGAWSHALMNGSLNLTLESLENVSSELSWHPTAIVDLNGDERDDILLRHSDGRWRVYLMDGNTVTSEQELPSFTHSWNWQFVGKGDLTGDGIDELLLRHSDGDWMSYRMEGDDVIAGVRSALALTRDLAWSTYHPVPLQEIESAPVETAQSVFEESVSQPIIQSRCINCHVTGGRSSHTRLVFVRSTNNQHLELNRKQFEDFLRDVENGKNRILNKVQGNLGHGGGTQISAGSDDYNNLEKFLNLVEQEQAEESAVPYAFIR